PTSVNAVGLGIKGLSDNCREEGSPLWEASGWDKPCRVGRASGEPHHSNLLVGLARGSTHPTQIVSWRCVMGWRFGLIRRAVVAASMIAVFSVACLGADERRLYV